MRSRDKRGRSPIDRQAHQVQQFERLFGGHGCDEGLGRNQFIPFELESSDDCTDDRIELSISKTLAGISFDINTKYTAGDDLRGSYVAVWIAVNLDIMHPKYQILAIQLL